MFTLYSQIFLQIYLQYNIPNQKMNKSLKRDSRMQDNNHINVPPKQKLQWQEIKTPSTIIHRRSCHSSCIFQNKLYVYGGYDNNEPDILADFYAFSLDTIQWKEVQQKGDLPGRRHSQSAIVYKEKMYMFGGVYEFMTNTNILHVFQFRTNTWTLTKTRGNMPPVDSHRCCLYQNQMIIGLGYSQNDYNPHLYSLDLDTLTWKTIFNAKNLPTQCYPEPRANGSLILNKNKIFIYGGRNFYQTFSDLWSFDLIKMRYSKVQLLNEIKGRFGHSAIIHNDKIYIFGGTRGVTHQRNDLIVIDLQRKFIKKCWPDSQQQRRKFKQQSSQIIKKSRRDSATKKCQQKNSEDLNVLQNQGSNYEFPGKYRSQLKEVAYYNDLYDSKRKKMDFKKKTHKNPLLSEIDQLSEPRQSENLNLTATFQILTNSIMLMQGKGKNREQKTECNTNDGWRSIPKARDNYSVDLWTKQDELCMIVFGGGMHKIGFNDVIKIDIKALNNKYLSG